MYRAREWMDEVLSRGESATGSLERRELELLIEEMAGISKLDLYLEHRPLSEAVLNDLEKAVIERATGRPLQHIIGKVQFAGTELAVDGRVLVPRPETEWIVNRIIQLEGENSVLRALDIGTGSGCIALGLKNNCRNWKIVGIDLSEDALTLAQENASRNKLNVDFAIADMRNLQVQDLEGKFDIIVSNPPYIPESEKSELPKEVLEFDPGMALFCEEDPLTFYRPIAAFPKELLASEARIYLECHEDFATFVVSLLRGEGYEEVILEKDLNGKDRLVRAVWKK